VTRDAFEAAWSDDHSGRWVGDLEASVRRVCATLEIADTDTLVPELLRLRSAASTATFVPRADAVETLTTLRNDGLRIGLITNCASDVPELWDASPLGGLADVTVFSAVEGIKKPAQAIYERAAARLAVPAAACVFVGDGHGGELDGAAAAGMLPVLLAPGDTLPPEGWSGLVVEQLSEVPALVRSL
jgi:putative hydrolase of the HAD superfamily